LHILDTTDAHFVEEPLDRQVLFQAQNALERHLVIAIPIDFVDSVGFGPKHGGEIFLDPDRCPWDAASINVDPETTKHAIDMLERRRDREGSA
jgi:hypothetical protein